MELKEAEEAERRAKLVNDILNDGTPTASDRTISCLPYLFPLLDATQYGQNFLAQLPPNKFVYILEIFYKVSYSRRVIITIVTIGHSSPIVLPQIFTNLLFISIRDVLILMLYILPF